ncbi:MAG: hypothetical protein KatS3mg033_1599 [Thermonema sp.]|jgi:hypothetical protein|uniref:DUF4783 domain-containing protein n=1 Tax=Thermonema TaxID=28194 RepID=UPI00056F71E8|nr:MULTISPECIES: DUF4783 domain-containing protein [Thermonema]GIV39799.1 MAG: hypothetical protein KatS3mg033_1599 [Thermonema sp.]
MAMPKIIILLFGFFFFHTASPDYSRQDTVLEEIERTFRIGSARELSRYFNEVVELSINDTRATYSKSQAEFIMRDFFKNYPPKSEGVEVFHQGSYQQSLVYSILRYQSSQKRFRVFIKLKEYRQRYLIDSITISEE